MKKQSKAIHLQQTPRTKISSTKQMFHFGWINLLEKQVNITVYKAVFFFSNTVKPKNSIKQKSFSSL